MYDKNTNKIIGTIEAPFLVDADGKEDYKSVEYKLEKNGENEALKVIVSNDYFENEATKYPVTIDPTMVWMFDYLTTASVWSVDFQQNGNMHNYYLGAMNNMIKLSIQFRGTCIFGYFKSVNRKCVSGQWTEHKCTKFIK